MVEITPDCTYTEAYSVTPSDSEDLESNIDCLYVGTGGNIKLTLIGNPETSVILKNISDSSSFRMAIKKIWAIGTTAQDMVVFK